MTAQINMDSSIPARITVSIIVPPTQNTAPVLEFRCLYTSDLRRKQKRWQDGMLKFHTFNKRVMVYDDRGNFVGDTHWREDHTFEEGEELDLERNGTLVQVSECIGKRDQDLTGLLRHKEREDRVLARTVTSSPEQKIVSVSRTQAANAPWEDPSPQRSAKRRKQSSSPASKVGYAQTLTGATLTLSGASLSRKLIPYDTLLPQKSRKPIYKINPPQLHKDHRQHDTARAAEDANRKQTNGGQVTKRGKSTQHQECIDPVGENTGALPFPSRRETTIDKSLPNLTRQKAPGQSFQRASKRTRDLEDSIPFLAGPDKTFPFHGDVENSAVACPQPIQTENYSRLPHRRQIPRKECQDSRHFNPLRIKPRPKRMLLLSAGPQNRSLLPPVGIAQGMDEAAHNPAAQETSTGANLSQATKRLDAFYQAQQQRLDSRLGGNHSLVVHEPQLPSPETGDIDHRAIHLLQSRNSSIQNDGIEVEKIVEKEYHIKAKEFNEPLLTVRRRMMPITRIGHDEEPKQLAEKTRNIDTEPEKLLVIDSLATRSEVEQPFADVDKSTSPQLTRPPCQMKILLEKVNCTTNATKEKRGFTRPVYSTCSAVESQDALSSVRDQNLVELAVKNDRLAKGSKPDDKSDVAIQSRLNLIPPNSVGHYGDVANRDKGPWSREAFDLFGWNPKTAASLNPVPT